MALNIKSNNVRFETEFEIRIWEQVVLKAMSETAYKNTESVSKVPKIKDDDIGKSKHAKHINVRIVFCVECLTNKRIKHFVWLLSTT